MTSVRDDRARQCDGKRTYLARADARRTARIQAGVGRGRLQVYRCPWCTKLHLGHNNRKTRSNESDDR